MKWKVIVDHIKPRSSVALPEPRIWEVTYHYTDEDRSFIYLTRAKDELDALREFQKEAHRNLTTVRSED